VLSIFLILMIGVSRIYLGVHYPSDVLAGFAAGGAWLMICLMGLRLVLEYRAKKSLERNHRLSPFRPSPE
jgi:membrane-associated phospholipid phosphatase